MTATAAKGLASREPAGKTRRNQFSWVARLSAVSLLLLASTAMAAPIRSGKSGRPTPRLPRQTGNADSAGQPGRGQVGAGRAGAERLEHRQRSGAAHRRRAGGADGRMWSGGSRPSAGPIRTTAIEARLGRESAVGRVGPPTAGHQQGQISTPPQSVRQPVGLSGRQSIMQHVHRWLSPYIVPRHKSSGEHKDLGETNWRSWRRNVWHQT